ncbi:MAG: hypothetical protein ABR569_04020 [Gaiellaceae bacterium]
MQELTVLFRDVHYIVIAARGSFGDLVGLDGAGPQRGDRRRPRCQLATAFEIALKIRELSGLLVRLLDSRPPAGPPPR